MNDSTFTVPLEKRYFEDYIGGSVHEYGFISVEQEEIISFAKRFDPQVFHTEPEPAKRTISGGLLASGWHTCGLMMRLFADHFLVALDRRHLGLVDMHFGHRRRRVDRGLGLRVVEVLGLGSELFDEIVGQGVVLDL